MSVDPTTSNVTRKDGSKPSSQALIKREASKISSGVISDLIHKGLGIGEAALVAKFPTKRSWVRHPKTMGGPIRN